MPSSSLNRLEGRVAIVTGAGAGFGEAIARLFAREGAHVAVLDMRRDAAERVAGEIGGTARAFAADVGVKTEVDAAVAEVARAMGAPKIVVNNAGWTHRNQPLLDVDEETFDKVFRVNVKSIYLMSMATVPLMRAAGSGVVVNISSTAGIRPRSGLSWYNGTKGAVNLLTKSLAVELAPDGIRVNALCPAMGETALLESLWAWRTRRRTASGSSPPFPWAACRAPPTSPRRRSIWRATNRTS